MHELANHLQPVCANVLCVRLVWATTMESYVMSLTRGEITRLATVFLAAADMFNTSMRDLRSGNGWANKRIRRVAWKAALSLYSPLLTHEACAEYCWRDTSAVTKALGRLSSRDRRDAELLVERVNAQLVGAA